MILMHDVISLPEWTSCDKEVETILEDNKKAINYQRYKT